MRELRIGKNDAGQRLDKYLHKYLREAGNSFIYKMLRKKNIKLNGARASGSEKLEEGDTVALYLSDETVEKFRGGAADHGGASDDRSSGQPIRPLSSEEIIYEDDDILILEKKAGELSQKAAPGDISINERMLEYLRITGSWDPDGTFTPSVCNRLDRNTSGIILAGKSLKGTQVLSEIIRERKIKKYYITLVESDFCDIIGNGDWFHLRGYLVKDEKVNKVFISDEIGTDDKSHGDKGAFIETAYRIADTVKDAKGDTLTKLEVELITGKTHQIRAHLSSIGHPIAGDVKYGSAKPGPYYLRAYRVIFPDDDRLDDGIRGREIRLKEDGNG